MPVRRVDLRVLLLLAAVGLTACTSNAADESPPVSKAAGSAVAVAAVANLGPRADALSAGTAFDDVGVVAGGNRYGVNSFAPTARLASLSGAEVVPTRAYVDIDVNGRPIEANVLFTVDGANYTVRARWTDYDEPVTIDPPSADEIATD